MKASKRDLSPYISRQQAANQPQLIPFIAFGDGMKGRMNVAGFKGHTVGRSERVRRLLQERMRQGHLIVSSIDEYCTSQVNFD